MAGAGADLYDGGSGVDQVDYRTATAGLTVNMVNGALSTGIAEGDRFVSIEWLNGTEFNDILITTGLSRIYANGGDDLIRDSAGQQSIWGGAGRDWFQLIAGDATTDRVMDFQIGQDVIDLSLWNAVSFDQLAIVATAAGVEVRFGAERVLLHGLAAAAIPQLNGASFAFAEPTAIHPNRWAGATVNGTVGDDTIDGAFRDAEGQGLSGGNQTIEGGAGNDIIFDGSGNDSVYGGDGNDLFHAGAGADRYFGGAGRNTLSYAYADGGVLIDMDTPANNAGAATGDVFSSISWLEGSDHSDVILVNGLARIYARAGDDFIRDGSGGQLLFGGSGRDSFAFVAGDGQLDRIMDFTIGEDLIDLRAWGVSDFAELTLETSGQDVIVRFGAEAVQLDRIAANLLTAANFIFAPPPPPAPMAARMASFDLPEASLGATVPEVSAIDPGDALAATMALAAAGGDAITFTGPAEGAAAVFQSLAGRSSYIAGDELASGQVAEAGDEPDNGPAGALVDPQTAITAFLSPTQLAALDGDQMSFY
jgi:Ca2+-binding RTX toxin-like protein